MIGTLYLIIPLILLIILSLKRVLNLVTFSNKDYMSDYQICLFACILITIWPIVPSLSFFNNWNSIIITYQLDLY